MYQFTQERTMIIKKSIYSSRQSSLVCYKSFDSNSSVNFKAEDVLFVEARFAVLKMGIGTMVD
jgi:hypothetical protein